MSQISSAPSHRKPGQWFARPRLGLLLAVSWLMLQQSLSVANILFAIVLGIVLPRLLHGFVALPRTPQGVGLAVKLTLVVLWDIIRSNFVVARIVLTPGYTPKPAWVPVPLDIHDPVAITLLANIITTTPGTVSAVVDEPNHRILVHALDCDDVAGTAAEIKERYEAPLKELLG